MGHGYANCAVPTCYRHPDRETGLSCSECGRPICTDCVTFAPVGLRCPDHAGVSHVPSRAVRSVQRPLARRGFVLTGDAVVTRILAGPAGALVWSPHQPTVGASGAIFGVLGAGLILEWRATGKLVGGFAVMILINLAFTFGFSSFISVGGHVGGLIGGLIGTAVIV